MLTSKQEQFAQNIADGMTQADAYRNAYNAENMSDNSIWVNASKLTADAKVAVRIKELKDKIAAKKLWTREMGVKALMRAYQIAEKNEQSSAMTQAAKELNAMHGYNEPTKIDHTSSDGSMSPNRQTLDDFYGKERKK